MDTGRDWGRFEKDEEMTDYAELLATKSQELAELTRAFNQHDYAKAESICRNITADFATLILIARYQRGV